MEEGSFSIENQEIRIGATAEYPYVLACFPEYPNNTCERVGIDLEYLYTVIVDVLKFTVKWHVYDSFTTVKQALNNGTIDIIGNTLILGGSKSATNQAWHQTPPSLYLGIGFLAKSHYVSNVLNPLASFTWDLWLSIIIATTVVFSFNIHMRKNCNLSFGMSRLFCVLWFLVVNIILEFYSNILTNDLLTDTKVNPAFNDLDDLGLKLMTNRCRLAIYSKYIDQPDLQVLFHPQHNKSWGSNFRTAFVTNPPIQVEEKVDLVTIIRNNSCVVGLDIMSGDLSVYNTFCDIDVKFFPHETPYHPYGYYHTLTWLKDTLEEVLNTDSFLQYGSVLFKSYTSSTTSTICNLIDDSETFNVPKVSYCFVLLLGGLLVALIVQIVNIILKTRMNHRKRIYVVSHDVEEVL